MLTIGAWLGVLLVSVISAQAAAALQFDVFVGYGGQPTGMDGVVQEGGWFAVGCEVHNEGPAFNAVFEFAPAQFGRGQTFRLPVELPTNTRKRFTLPAFAGFGYYGTWKARLLDEKGRVRAELTNLRPRSVAGESVILGALPRTFAGLPKLPALPELRQTGNPMFHQPMAARLLAEQMPDNPIALEGLTALYLNSEKALELKAPQADALVSWTLGGGHLIVAVEDPAEVNAATWLRGLVPARLGPVMTLKGAPDLAAWGEPLPASPAANQPQGMNRPFAKYDPAALHRPSEATGIPAPTRRPADPRLSAEFAVTTASITDADVLLAANGTPLVVRARRGRGQVTLLTFSPEREPFRSWEQREWFWARLLQLPPAWFETASGVTYRGSTADGFFGVMIDSRQAQTLPVPWLLALLVVYLAVIGPVDRYLLKRWKREMLTWVTFPAYVAFFSLLIYYLGYRLRAGDTEWNELHVVDIIPRTLGADWRGRTYASIYSPVNARYRLVNSLPHAALRGEYLGWSAGGQESSRINLVQRGQGFEADIFVPVWTSQLCVSDWLQREDAPLTAALILDGAAVRLQVTNHLDRPVEELRLAFRDQVYDLGQVAPRAKAELVLDPARSATLRAFVHGNAGPFTGIIEGRRRTYGGDNSRWPGPTGGHLTAISFLDKLTEVGLPMAPSYGAPAGLDLTPLVERGDAVLLAWLPNHAPVATMRQFRAVRMQQNTLFRLMLPAGPSRLL